MKEMITNAAYFAVVLTLVCYGIGLFIKKKTKCALANPMVIATIIIIGLLVWLDIDYEVYQEAVRPLSFWLTPATVCLAIPLYRQLHLLKKYPVAILGGILSGVLTTMVCILLMSLAFGLTHEQYVTLLPKSVTTAIGMGVSEKIGGIVSITVAAISITGIMGNVTAEFWLKLMKIEEPIAKGLAIGTASHALGTTKAMEIGEIEGAMSSLSIVVTGILTVIAVSVFMNFI